MTGNHNPVAGVDFDQDVDRRGTASTKWQRFEQRDILPFWIADMDFPAPDFVLDAVRGCIDHGVPGYSDRPRDMPDLACAWLERHWHWRIDPAWLVWLPGVVPGMNQACRAVGEPGDRVLVPTPIYPPFLTMPGNARRHCVTVPLARDGTTWVMDLDALATASTPDTRLLLLANPQNPTGRVYRRQELADLAAFAERHGITVVSDEIHAPLVLDPAVQHTPIASLDPAIAQRTISLFSTTKAYNTAALGCAFAVIPDPDLRRRFKASHHGLVPSVSQFAWAAARAALADTGPWLAALNSYLAANHQHLAQRLADLPGVQVTPAEATCLAWLDVRALNLAQPGAWFRDHGLALNDGADFGCPGFVRFNVGCPRSLLDQGLDRFHKAVQQHLAGHNSA